MPEKLLKTPLFDNSYSYDVLGDRNTLSREQLVIYTLYDDLCSVGEDEIADKRKALYDKLKCYISNKPDCDDCNNEKQLHSANFMSNNTPLDLKNLFQMVVDGNPAKIEAYVTYKDIGDPIYERTVGYKTASEGKFMLAYMIAGVTVFQNDQSYSVFSKHIIDEFMSQENWSQINPQREQRYLFGIYE